MASDGSAHSRSQLYARLSGVLGQGLEYKLHHLSSRPTKSDALFAAPPGHKPQRTYCESHFLTVSIPNNDGHVFVFAIEVLIYTTKSLTTLFVSKADSTGHLSLQPTKSRQSPIRPVTSTFISWLVEHRQRPGIPLVVSLFARAQDQYLFPGSVDHGAKHVLDDRQLVKWWCKTLDPVMRSSQYHTATCTRAHVIVPGFDSHETTSFFPPSWRSDPPHARKWQYGHPLFQIAPNPSAPPRCLVPHFPDDPKARYLDELDDEIPDSQPSQSFSSPSKKGSGMWKSVRTLDQFWDMMAFRQECSSGRMVGFIWLVFMPEKQSIQSFDDAPLLSFSSSSSFGAQETDPLKQPSQPNSTDTLGTKKADSKRRPKKKLTGPIIPRQPRIKSSSSDLSSRSDKSVSRDWPIPARGQVVLDHAAYTRVHDLLLRLDFATADAATSSTRKWLNEVTAITASTTDWGEVITGNLPQEDPKAFSEAISTSNGQVNDLSGMIVRKKRKNVPDQHASVAPNSADPPDVNVLSGSTIEKKPKTT